MGSAVVHDGARLFGNVVLGDGVEIYPGAIIGLPGESHDRESDMDKPLYIGAGTTIRENVVIQRGLRGDRGTYVGRGCYLMHGTHVGHDVNLSQDVTVSPHAVLGGHSTVMRGATLGILSATHQFVTVGAYAMLGMGAMLIDDLPPGCTAAGVPARIIGRNRVGIERHNVTNPDLRAYENVWNSIRNRKEAQ